jgi:regulator-associated protein of mTOR
LASTAAAAAAASTQPQPPLSLPLSNSLTQQAAQARIRDSIHLGACGLNEVLPTHTDLPLDIFTACLTTPIKAAVYWYVSHKKLCKLVPGLTLDLLEKIPGQINDRRTMLGELNWIFTAITDTIAWNVLDSDLFQKLFRQDLLVASLFRNFLLAERIMKSLDCTPVSHPPLPPTHEHSLWQSWDLALDSKYNAFYLFLGFSFHTVAGRLLKGL